MGSAELLKNEELLLTALSGESELYGLQILNLIETASNGEIIINYGSLYPLLNKLEEKGYVQSRWEEQNQRKGPRRRYYKITPEGANLVTQSQLLRERLKELAKNSDVSDSLEEFSFEVVTVDHQGKIVKRVIKQAQFFTEKLGNDCFLEMVYIPGGTFWMGTEKREIERLNKKYNTDFFSFEKPQHEVTVSPFFMSKYPVTQAQWKAIVSRSDLPIEHDLDPNPSSFKGDNLPVETVSWKDAVEFCQRLSRLTKRKYRLPSEAEWEYACRAITSYHSSVISGKLTAKKWNESYHQPFHFGETITSDLANYNGNYTYANELQGQNRAKTTPVGSFPPNAFGLYDMHGNVWEWCADDWHQNYQDAPKDGSVWLSKNSNTQVVRGGCWFYSPDICRSAYRINGFRVNRYFIYGFRVVCVAFRTTK